MGKHDDDKESPTSNAIESFSNLYEYAIEAEQATGKRETSKKRAKRSLIARVFSILLGTVITTFGFIMLVAPGPGILVIAAGLTILAIDVPFARRLLNIVIRRLPQDETGKLTKRTILIMITTALVGLIVSVVSIWMLFTKT